MVDRRLRTIRAAAFTLIAVPVAYVSSCAYVSSTKSAAFDAVKIGDPEALVVAKLGSPSVREEPGVLFTRYASTACKDPCAQRLWFENRLSLDTQAWSVELNANAHVVKKSQWMSP